MSASIRGPDGTGSRRRQGPFDSLRILTPGAARGRTMSRYGHASTPAQAHPCDAQVSPYRKTRSLRCRAGARSRTGCPGACLTTNPLRGSCQTGYRANHVGAPGDVPPSPHVLGRRRTPSRRNTLSVASADCRRAGRIDAQGTSSLKGERTRPARVCHRQAGSCRAWPRQPGSQSVGGTCSSRLGGSNRARPPSRQSLSSTTSTTSSAHCWPRSRCISSQMRSGERGPR